jgi:citrate lyase subunit beta/citryl-CoA lyase
MASRLSVPTTYLCVSGSDRAAISAGLRSSAGALVVDLAVAADDDDDARIAVREQVAHVLAAHDGVGPPVWVRVNPGDDGLDDIALIVPEGADVLAGLFIPDVLDTIDLDAVGRELELAEAAADREDRPVPLYAVLASASAVLDAREIAEHERVSGLGLDDMALAADLGLASHRAADGDGGPALDPLHGARTMVVLAGAAARRAKPVAWNPSLGADALWALGFGGRVVLSSDELSGE